MKTIQTTLYNFSELSQEAQEKALENLSDINTDSDFWHKNVIDDAKECGKLIGINIDKVYFSGFSSQGDGACFEGEYSYNKGSVKKIKRFAPKDTELHRIASALSAIQKKNSYSLRAIVKHDGHYYHSRCTDISISKNDEYTYSNDPEELTEALRDFMNWIYSQLEKEYEYQTSRESILQTIEANEYTFEANGELHNA